MASVQDSHLVERALRMAHALHGDMPGGLVFHDDRGTQFTERTIVECVSITGHCSICGPLD